MNAYNQFNADFFPTPKDVALKMISATSVKGKTILEPSAGKGDLVQFLWDMGAKNVYAYEKNLDLAEITKTKAIFKGYDFLEAKEEELSHIDKIIMNPPFSKDEKHILHAWDIAPEGCEIISLCNTQTVQNQYSSHRKRLGQLIADYGDATEHLGQCFSSAERKTGAEVTIVKLFKPIVSKEYDYEGFYMDLDEDEFHQDGLMRYSEIQSVVSRYINAIKCFDEFASIANNMDSYVKPFGLSGGFSFSFQYNDKVTTKIEFSKELQKRAWKHIFNKLNITKYITEGCNERY